MIYSYRSYTVTQISEHTQDALLFSVPKALLHESFGESLGILALSVFQLTSAKRRIDLLQNKAKLLKQRNHIISANGCLQIQFEREVKTSISQYARVELFRLADVRLNIWKFTPNFLGRTPPKGCARSHRVRYSIKQSSNVYRGI